MNTETDLNTRLTREADGFFRNGGTTLELSQVLDRAGEIKRGRRMRATMLMAACVLAIAAPTVLIATGGNRTRPPVTPAKQVKVDHSPLTLEGLERGNQPHDGYAVGSEFRVANGSIGLAAGKATVAAVARIEGGVLVATRDESGALTARFVDDQGGTTRGRWPMSGGFATTPDDAAAAFVQPDGTPVLVRAADLRTLEPVPGGGALTAAAVTGSDCTRPNVSGCTVWTNDGGAVPTVWMAYAGGTTKKLDTDLRSVVDVDGQERMAGVNSVSDTGSCSEVGEIGKRTLWKTCKYSLLSFSPDSQHLLATSAYRDGAGDTEIAVLDSATGRSVLDLRTTDGAFVTQLVWEDDMHVLANTYERGRWAVVRIGLDGRRMYAVPPVAGNDYDGSPFVLPTR
jgi:hypothetical protein